MAQKVVTKGEIFILVIIAIIILSFTLQKCGVNVMSTSEDAEMIDKPHHR
jgi:hypothetical protein